MAGMGAGDAGMAGAAGMDSTGGTSGSAPVITSSVVDSDMTQEKFTAMCDEKGGTIEIHPHCGGANSCKGMSYDTATHVLTEHTCKGMNTCAGYSCVLP